MPRLMDLPKELRVMIFRMSFKKQVHFTRPAAPPGFGNILPSGERFRPLNLPLLRVSKQVRAECIVEYLRSPTLVFNNYADILWLQEKLKQLVFDPPIELSEHVRQVLIWHQPSFGLGHFALFLYTCKQLREVEFIIDDTGDNTIPLRDWTRLLRLVAPFFTTLDAFDFQNILRVDSTEVANLRDELRRMVLKKYRTPQS